MTEDGAGERDHVLKALNLILKNVRSQRQVVGWLVYGGHCSLKVSLEFSAGMLAHLQAQGLLLTCTLFQLYKPSHSSLRQDALVRKGLQCPI